MKELIEQVVQWGRDRGLDKVGHLAQAKYTLKETAELLDAYADGDVDKMNDAIGDIAVTLIVGASNSEEVLREFTEFMLSGELYHQLANDGGVGSSVEIGNNMSDLTGLCFQLILYSTNSKPSVYYYNNSVAKLHYCLMSLNACFNQELCIKDCLQLAYDEIKNRKGKLVNGQFIKDGE